jgi:hypothetical protein
LERKTSLKELKDILHPGNIEFVMIIEKRIYRRHINQQKNGAPLRSGLRHIATVTR